MLCLVDFVAGLFLQLVSRLRSVFLRCSLQLVSGLHSVLKQLHSGAGSFMDSVISRLGKRRRDRDRQEQESQERKRVCE